MSKFSWVVVIAAGMTFSALPAVAASPAASSPGTSPVKLAPQINAADFAYFDKTLASDGFGGRKPGTIGATHTSQWLIQQYQRMGLQPGNHGSWFQTVPADSTTLLNPDLQLDIDVDGKQSRFAYRTDMMVQTLQAKAAVDLKHSPVVFLGYGVDAPQWHWNDYKGVDVRGKTVIVLVNDPGFATSDPKLFDGRAMTYYGRWTYKYAEAARQGAAACFIVHTSNAAAGYPFTVLQNSGSGPQLSLPASVDPAPRLPVAGWLTHDAATRLFAAAGKNFDALAKQAATPGFKPVPLGATASVTLHNKITHIVSKNVVAMVKGSRKPDQVVIFTAHWDHLGTDPSLKGHKVYSGAIDNGTGLSMLLELANAFAHQKTPPQRTLLFFNPTLEESGLLGSQYYAAKPVFPLDQTVADIAVDALPIIGRAHDMTVIGKGQSQLEDMLADVLKSQGRVTTAETTPENGFYFRSDHFSFAKAGVPAMLASSGLDLYTGGKAAGEKAAEDYTAHRYHTPSDIFNPNWDYTGILQDTQALYELGQQLSVVGSWPHWYENSPFRAARQKMMGTSNDDAPRAK
jgi:Zn-dependent M28 family amino/carboxypeptidase